MCATWGKYHLGGIPRMRDRRMIGGLTSTLVRSVLFFCAGLASRLATPLGRWYRAGQERRCIGSRAKHPMAAMHLEPAAIGSRAKHPMAAMHLEPAASSG